MAAQDRRRSTSGIPTRALRPLTRALLTNVDSRLLADALVVAHLVFIVFVVAGGLIVLRWPRVAWLHLPAVAWGIYAEATATVCPLTPLENLWRRQAGDAGYAGGFVEHYLVSLIYPAGLTPRLQLAIAAFVTLVNLVIYAAVWRNRRKRAPRATAAPARGPPEPT